MKKITFNASYTSNRPDIEQLISPNARLVLDVGCSTGKLGESIKVKYGAYVVGIELSEEMADIAKTCLDKVLVGSVSSILLENQLDGYSFDTIIFGDILEHLVDPWETLKASNRYLKEEGYVIASIPNVRFIGTIINILFKGQWPHRERGIHDKTHLRFFTLKSIKEMFLDAGYEIIKLRRNYRFIDKPHYINRISKYFALPILKGFLTYQYLIVAKKIS